MELANRYWTYQHLRMGRAIEVLPIRGSQTHDWMPIGALLFGQFDDTLDPGGTLRQAQQLFQQVRAAYQAGDAETFHRASEEFVAALLTAGPELGEYASVAKMELEVAYNTWAPFRFAWILMLLALVGMLLHLGSGWKVLVSRCGGHVLGRAGRSDNGIRDAHHHRGKTTRDEHVRVGDLRRLRRGSLRPGVGDHLSQEIHTYRGGRRGDRRFNTGRQLSDGSRPGAATVWSPCCAATSGW